MHYRVDKEKINNILKDDITEILIDKGEFGHIEYLCEAKDVIDDTTKILIYNKRNKKVAILLCSFVKYSNIPERNMEYSQEIKLAIGPETGDVILNPMFSGVKDGISYVVWPYCNPISSNPIIKRIQLIMLKRPLFEWIKNTTQMTLQKVNSTEIKRDFILPLEQLSKNEKIGIRIRNEASSTIFKLNEKKWVPYFVLAHNDLWPGNILMNKSGKYKFVLIDWAGAKMKSYAISDMLSLFFNTNFSQKRLKNELIELCNILKCDIEDSKCYLLSSLAYLGMNLDQFPEKRYLEVVDSICNYLFSTLD